MAFAEILLVTTAAGCDRGRLGQAAIKDGNDSGQPIGGDAGLGDPGGADAAASDSFTGDPGVGTHPCDDGSCTIGVSPIETDDLLHNPGIGFTDFVGVTLGEDEQPRATVRYNRWYWDQLEPQEGVYDWANTFDRELAMARERGQTVDWRIMPNAPQWLIDKGVAAMPVPDAQEKNIPDHNNPTFLSDMEELIQAIAARYGESPDFNMIDIGSVGRWGEWHNWVDASLDVERASSYLVTADNAAMVVDWYYQYFPTVPKTVLVGYLSTFQDIGSALPRGAGWRADCFGDYGWTSPSDWNHMTDAYPAVANGIASTAWQRGPVSMESCGVAQDWLNAGFDIDLILAKGLEWHVSTFNNKSSPVPQVWRAKFDEWLKHLGYRLVVTEIQHSDNIIAGGQFVVRSSWANRGVAPAYYRWPIAYRLRSGAGEVVARWTSSADIRTWLPGDHDLDETFAVPPGILAGTYALDVAILDLGADRALLELALTDRQSDGWYNLSAVVVR